MKNELGKKLVKSFSLDKRFLQFSGQQKIAKELNALHSSMGNEKQLYTDYLSKKIEYLIWTTVGILFLLVMVWLMPQDEGELNSNIVIRNGYEGLEKNIYLTAKSEGLEEEIEVVIEPLHYTKKELDIMAEEVFSYFLDNMFPNKEQGVYVVTNHLKFPTKIEGYPFDILWESSDYNIIDSNGRIMAETYGRENEVTVTVVLSCYEYSWEKEYALVVYSPDEIWEDVFSEKVEKTIQDLNATTLDKKEIFLPEEIDGHQVVYEEKKDNPFVIIIGIGIVIMIFVWSHTDSNLSRQTEFRNNQLLVDYAKLISKLSLYMGAGLSFRTAVSKIVESADKNRFYTKELEIVVRELENGISEQKAVNKLAERCKLPCYIKLSVLINQNIRKGNNSLQKQLKEETDKAFEERKNLAKKYGEEAGTKLLFPMIMILVVVMIMVMYPAFVSFTV